MSRGRCVVAFFEGSLAEVVVQKSVRPAAPRGEGTQTQKEQQRPVHAHSAASLGKVDLSVGECSEVEASDGRFPVGPVEAEDTEVKGLARFSREVADRKQKEGCLVDENVWDVGHLIQGARRLGEFADSPQDLFQ
jgi:hypothetical protein